MKLPSIEESYALLKKYNTAAHVIRHSEAVRKVSNYLALQLKQRGININLDLVDRAALLHDIMRMVDVDGKFFARSDEADKTEANKAVWTTQSEKYKDQHHAEAAQDVLKDYPELGNVIREHMFDIILHNKFKTWEGKIVHYADKRVDEVEIVSLNERLRRGKLRWTTDTENLELTFKKLHQLEKEIFDLIGQDPEILAKIN